MEKAKSSEFLTEIWREYQDGQEYLQSAGLFSRAKKCHQMVTGDQWNGLKSGSDRPPQLNILLPMMKDATALVGQNTMAIRYSSMDYTGDRRRLFGVCEALNSVATKLWEKLKLAKYQWDVLTDAYITGDSFLYFYDDGERVAMNLLDTTNVFLADEQNADIQEQPYILIVQRRYVTDVKKEARENGISDEEIEKIVPDDDMESQIGGSEVKNSKKLISVLKLWKEDGEVHFARSTKSVVYQKDTVIDNLKLYPVAKYSWKPQKGAARGMGDVFDKISNQISINKSLYRFESAVKTSSFPHKIYNEDFISETEVAKLSYPDSNIAVRTSAGQDIRSVISYLNPVAIPEQAKSYWQDLIGLTRNLAGAGDSLANINPEKASGAAINAARDAKLLSVNSQVAAFKQFIEDIALIFYDMWVAYNPNGMEIMQKGEDGEYSERIDAEDLQGLRVDVKIDVSPNNPYSKLAQEMELKDLFVAGAISFEEYVDALSNDSNVPKGKLSDILKKREQTQGAQMQNEEAARAVQEGQIAQLKLIELTNAMQGGGMENVLR